MKLPKSGDLILGKYLLEQQLGEGGMGVVYAARHKLLGQRVAVKLIRPEYAVFAESVGRFLNEARATTSIDNDHVARVLDFGMLEDGLPYMVLEYLEGTDLSQMLATQGPLPIVHVVDCLLQAIEAIAHAHAAGIVHRDLKPSNIFLARRPDGTSRVKVLDFGISKITSPSNGPANMTRSNSVLGSPTYMSPEQLRDSKNADHRSDIWALGVVAYELLTGRAPFEAENVVALFAVIQESQPRSLRELRPDVSPELEAVIMRCLRRVPTDRYASVTELAFALSPYGSPIAARSAASSDRILPLERTSSPSATSGVDLSATQPDSPLSQPGRVVPVAPAFQRTASAMTTSSWGTTPGRVRLTRVVAIGAGFAAVAILGSVIVVRMTRNTDTAQASPSTSLVIAEPSASPSTLASSAPIPSAASSSLTVPVQVVSATATSAPATTHAAAPVRPPPVKIAPPPATKPRVNCDTKFDIDPATGKKIWKRECL